MHIASHNVMFARGAAALLDRYRALFARRSLDVLCLQEDVLRDGTAFSDRVAAAVGPQYRSVAEHFCDFGDHRAGLAVIYNTAHLRLLSTRIVELPLLGRLSAVERLYVKAGVPEPKLCLLARFAAGNEVVRVFCFHLDSAGGTEHRRRQIACVAALIRSQLHATLTIVCGDTNAFSWTGQRRTLSRVLEPLHQAGLQDVGGPNTYHFSRMRGGTRWQRLAVAVSRATMQVPCRLDVICSDAPATAHGCHDMPMSDHDLVWAKLQQPLLLRKLGAHGDVRENSVA